MSGLCFVSTINWGLIARWDSMKNFVANNMSPDDCPGHYVCQEAGCPLGLCWTSTQCQIQSSIPYGDCHPECAGNCSGPGPKACHSCRKYLTLDMECVSTCPNETYIHLNQRCVTKEHCLSLVDHQNEVSKDATFVVFNNSCVPNCPAGYDYTEDRTGCEQCEGGNCRKICLGLLIDTIEAARNLKDCTFIDGSLEISIKNGNHRAIAEILEESLKSIEEIKGYLKIIRCSSLVSLNFFKKLLIIHGFEPFLQGGKYSVIILDNENLQELWNITASFKILNGRIFFHYNPKLCFYYIENLISVAGLENVNNFEVAQESNGDKFACDIIDVDVQFSSITPNSVSITISIPNQTNYTNNLQRYVLYYKEASQKNLSPFEVGDECGDENWKVKDVLIGSEKEVLTEQSRLKPFTQYAFYVKTYTTNKIGGRSPTYYIHTLPSRPSEVFINMYYSNTSSSIVLSWDPPKYINGDLTDYIITGFWQKDDRNILDQRNYCEYPLEMDTVEYLATDIQTNIESENITCCPENQIVYRRRGEFVKLCENSGERKLLIDEDKHEIIESCIKYSYDFAYEESLLSNKFEKNKRIINAPGIKRIVKRDNNGKSGKVLNNKSKPYPESPNKSKLKYGAEFYHIARKGTKTFVINNLHHFAKYTISVRACRGKHRGEKYDDYDNRCSKSEIVTIRTLKDALADTINDTLVVFTVLEYSQDLQITWPEPTNPNGAILLFLIELQRNDEEDANPIEVCLTYLEYIQSKRKYFIKELTPGAYYFRLRAESLAGVGPFTKPFHFTISRPNRTYLSHTVVFIFIPIVFIVVSISAFYFILRQRQENFSDLEVLVPPTNREVISHSSEDTWEISKENVQILKELSKGSFVTFYEGLLYPLKLPCMVKKTLTNKGEFLKEITVLKQAVGVHHIVQLLGMVSNSNLPMVIIELMSLGDLKTFLHSTRKVPLHDLRFFKMAAQIADAMFFMEENKLVHRDLAARNCMVNKDLTVKLGDFGLSRELHSKDYFRKTDRELLPVRWMAPESLKHGLYTSHSDVWSYGVVLWEIATLAEQPYGGLTNEQVLRWVIDGKVLYTPVFCPHNLKTIMELCWIRNPNQRPSFQQIVSHLESYTDEAFRQVSYYHTSTTRRE